MSKKNVAHSVRERLLNLSRQTGEDFQLLLTRYAVERFLFRLARSKHADAFILKGAMLFALWTGEMHRPTRDVDLLGFGDSGEERLREAFLDVCAVDGGPDGLAFDPASVVIEAIREDQEYDGQRAIIRVTLGQARIDLQVDVGFGDAVTPAAEEVQYPTLLEMESPKLRAYPRDTVVAEKLEAIVKLGLANSRMKDYFDLLILARTFDFKGQGLANAVAATFRRRRTEIPSKVPLGLSEAFATDDSKLKQWNAFLKRSELDTGDGGLRQVVNVLVEFLWPVLQAAKGNESFPRTWMAGGPWA